MSGKPTPRLVMAAPPPADVEATAYDLGVTVGEHLLGTCQSFIGCCEQLELDEGFENDHSFAAGLDQTAMLCLACDWWVEPGELDDAQHCVDCQDEE